ncbi:family 16 glycosylhydrolase [Flammeovirga pectinis]|uniref:family 16 glycosylhydrolase n=1 Tax=Flammeovirga pectinis TaxID=2494373 RepID=UPI001477161F|nr:family 16 glycosylhydrolase [Flammeovirga pectinis]
MKNLLLTLLTLLPFTIFGQDDCYEMVWSDEFNYSGAPDAEKWGYDTGGDGWGNNEDQYYTDRLTNAQVASGKLKITARKENYKGKYYTSARLVSKGKGDWLYGKIVVRAKLPTGQGTWPAIWMLSTDWEYGGWPASGEIDIMEHVGYDPNVVHGTVHTESYHHSINTQVGKHIDVSDATSNFHDYILEWDENKIKLYVDDTNYFTFTKHGTYKEWPFDKQFHLLLNIAMGGNWGAAGGPTDDTALPASMEVDYVRVYQNTTPQMSISGASFADKSTTETYSVDGVNGVVTWEVPNGASIVSGQSTNTITVAWSDTAESGDIKAVVVGNCDTYTSTFNVKVIQGMPSTPQVSFEPVTANGDLLWSVPENFEGTFSLNGSDTVSCVLFDVDDPATNPYIYYSFDEILDLNGHTNFTIDLKFKEGLFPDQMRVDLSNESGDDISGDNFRIRSDAMQVDCNIWRYTYSFDPNELNLSRVGGIKLYINYGFSAAMRGGIEISDFTFNTESQSNEQISTDNSCGCIDDIPLSADGFVATKYVIAPNPSKSNQTLTIYGSSVSDVSLFDLQGRLIIEYTEVKQNKIVLPHLSKGIYAIRVVGQQGAYTTQLIIN